MWKNLTGGLHTLLDDLRRKQNNEDETFKVAIEEAVKKCRNEEIIPKVDEIEKNKYGYNRNSYKITHLIYVDQIRAKLSDNFNALGGALGELLKAVQLSVIKVFIEQGNLGALTSNQGNDFFEDIAQQLPKSAVQIKKAFQDIKQEKNSYDKIVKEWIKDYLEKLQPDINLDPISQRQITQVNNPNAQRILDFIEQLKVQNNSEFDNQISRIVGHAIKRDNIAQIRELVLNPVLEFIKNKYQASDDRLNPTNSFQAESNKPVETTNFSQEDVSEAELIREKLETLREEVVDSCHETLQQRLSEPNKLAFTMVANFLNQVLASENAETEWRKFFRRNKDQVWDGAKQKQKYKNLENEWQELVNSAQEANETDKMQLPLS